MAERRAIVAAAAALSTLLLSVAVGAEEEATLAGQVGYATEDYGVGLGVRGGMRLESSLYLGAAGVYHLGTEKQVESAFEQRATSTVSILLLGGELGWDFTLAQDKAVVRPSVGAGVAALSSEVCLATCSDEDDNVFYLAPGATAFYYVGESWFLGLDARLYVLDDYDDAIGVYGLGGLRL